MELNFNDPLVQLEAIKLMKPVPSFLHDMFVDDRGAVAEEDAIWDCKRGDVPMAPFVHDTTGGVPIGRTGFVTDHIIFPTIAPERIVKALDIKNRSFGENVYGGLSPEERAENLIANDLQDLRDMIQKTREWMISQLLINGKIDILKFTGQGQVTVAEQLVDFDFKNKYVATKKWNQADCDIEADIENCVDIVSEGLGNCEVIIMAQNVKNAIFNNDKYLGKLDKKHLYIGEMFTKYNSFGVTFIGYAPGGQEMYVYNRTYNDHNGDKQKLIPDGTMLLGSRKMIQGYHGPVTQITENGPDGKFKTFIEKEVPLRYADMNANNTRQRLISRPMFVPKNIDGWCVAKVLE